MLVIGHRANNKLILKRYLRVKNINGIEIDLMYKNDKIMIKHDKNPVRRPSISGRIIDTIDYLFFYRNPYLGLFSLKLNELLRIVEEKNIFLILDIDKPETIIMLFKQYNKLPSKTIFTSKNHQVIRYVKEVSRYKGLVSIDSSPINIVDIVNNALADGVSMNKVFITEKHVDDLHSNGLIIYAWIVNEEETARKMYRLGVDGIITDIPSKMIKLIHNLTLPS
jgi:glycerophosphoryl diester phosphodiesterase